MIARQSRVSFAPSARPDVVAEIAGADPAVPLFRDLLGALPWSQLRLIAGCAARQVGSGNEIASFAYDDDIDEDEEPFEGVRLTGDFRDEVAVFTRAEWDAILADFFELVVALATRADEPWWPDFVEDARRVAARTARPLATAP